jgi:hypothetical protein
MQRMLLALCGAIAANSTVMAQDETPAAFTHAVFVEGNKSIENLVRFPKHDGDIEITVSCLAHATAKGRLQDARCSAAEDPDRKFSTAVDRRTRSARLVPATVNGKSEEVDIQFSIAFSKKDDVELITLRMNNGNNADRLGTDYVAAQRYSPHAFPSVCKERAFADQGLTKIIVEAAIIDVQGRSRDAQIFSPNWSVPGPCESALKGQIEAGAWIPASLNGEYVESAWLSPIVVARSDSGRYNSGVTF